MKYYSILLFIIVFAAACSSSESNKPPQGNKSEQQDMTQLSTPDTSNYAESKVYIDSVKSTEKGLLIAGNLPDGCSKLHEASHKIQGDTLSITLTAWKPADKMCTQALTPFRFMYEQASPRQIEDAPKVTVNGKSFEI